MTIAIRNSAADHMRNRRDSLRRGGNKHLTSFRLPKDQERKLLQDTHDIWEDDDNVQESCADSVEVPAQQQQQQQQQQVPAPACLGRRKMALQRTAPRMTSFRLPKNATHRLLQEHLLDDDDDWEEETQHDSPSAVPPSPVPNKIKNLPVRRSRRDSLNKRRCALSKEMKKMNSFRLPKETTKPLLHFDVDSDPVEDDDDGDMIMQDDSKTPPSFDATTAPPAAIITKKLSPVRITRNHRESLNKRRSALSQQMRKMNSFRLPKETTKPLLHFDVDQEEVDDE
jgi:hypothetical protein